MVDPTLTLNEDFLVDDYELIASDHSPAVEVVDPGRSAPPGAPHDLLLSPSTLQTLSPARHGVNQWDPRFILDLAIGIDSMPEILDRYSITPAEFDALSQTQVFRKELALAIRDARENGLSFAQKAKVQAESYLEVMDQLVYDVSTPASTRLETIRSMVKWGRLEVVEKEGGGTNAQQINISISF